MEKRTIVEKNSLHILLFAVFPFFFLQLKLAKKNTYPRHIENVSIHQFKVLTVADMINIVRFTIA